MWWAILLLVLASTGSQAQGIDPDRMKLFIERRTETLDCYRQHTARLDDSLSDARTIGEVISNACENYELAEIQGITGAVGPEARTYRGMRRDRYLANATEVVLEQRAARAKARR